MLADLCAFTPTLFQMYWSENLFRPKMDSSRRIDTENAVLVEWDVLDLETRSLSHHKREILISTNLPKVTMMDRLSGHLPATKSIC